jgi:two-component system CheB/CheR fusion protein
MLNRMPDTAHLPTVVRSAATIQRSVDSQVKIIDDLMDLSRLRTGKLTLHRAQVSLGDVVAEVISLVSPDARQRRVALLLEPATTELYVYGDQIRIEQIIWNLLSNGIKFTPPDGQVHVRLSRQDDFACVEVTDTGRGIAAEFLPFVFDMFRQADAGTTREYGGMGIGLALVRELVSSHGGRVEAASEGIGHGARFRVFLPLFLPQQPTLPAAPEESRSLAGKRILLVDDSTDTLVSMTELLAAEHAEVTAAPSAAEALRLAADSSEPYHLIISDIGMPGMDGNMLLAELRKFKATGATPAIALSGFTRDSDVERALAAGFKAHARKPVNFNQLLAMASRVSS